MTAPFRPDDPLRHLAKEQVEALIASWIPADRADLSEHARLEIAYALDAGHEPGDPPPLDDDDPVPGCTCARCLALGKGATVEEAYLAEVVVWDLARVPPASRLQTAQEVKRIWEDSDLGLPAAGWLTRQAERVPGAVRSKPDPDGPEDRGLPVEEARRTSILQVARRLGLGKPRQRGQEHVVHCPLHRDENPSLRLNETEAVWHCFPCGEGGDGIDLVMQTRRCSFPKAVHWISEGAAGGGP